FFSSRRRHTRCYRDWSSDVCSSDLLFFVGFLLSMYYLVRLLYSEKFALVCVILLSLGSQDVIFLQLRAVGEYPEMMMFAALICRSEERRVGKEWCFRW